MALVAHELVDDSLVDVVEVVVEVAFFSSPLRQRLDNSLQVLYAVFACTDGVVAQVFALGARVVVVAFATKPIAAAFLELLNGFAV